ncbi:MAG TPA: ABC transporter permease subunit [Dongiaceae bacterium]|nr:ABC transporter permease subunit [Dongiaceae bacterium]
MSVSGTHRDGAAAIARGAVASTRYPAAARKPARFSLAAALIYAAFALLIAVPLLLVLAQAVVPGLFDVTAPSLAPSLQPLLRAFSSSTILVSVLHSLELAAMAAASATALGAGFAFLVQRCDLPGRRVLAALPWLVFLTPSYLKALAWVLLMSPGGYLTQLGVISSGFAHGFFSLPGLIFVQTLNLFPLAAFVIGSALAGLGSEYEDAARLAGARPRTVWLRINLPLLAPAIALSLIAIFAEGLSDFGMAATIARNARFDLLTYGIYAAASDYPVDFPLAGAQALILLCLVVAVVLADRMLRRQTDPKLISGRSRPARRTRLGLWRLPATAALILVAILALGLPLAGIAVRAVTRTLGAGLSAENFTAAQLAAALSPETLAGSAFAHSLFYAVIAAFLACAAAILLSAELDRAKRVMKPLILAISLGAVAIPGVVLGFGYILLWNRLPGFRDAPFPDYGSPSLLVMGYAAAALPYCLIIILAAIGQLAPSLGDAARLQGAESFRRLVRITLPLIFLSIVTAFLLTFIRTVFELPISQLLIPTSGTPAPPVVIRLFNHDGDGLASALSLVSMLATGGAAGAIWAMAKRIAPRRVSATGADA